MFPCASRGQSIQPIRPIKLFSNPINPLSVNKQARWNHLMSFPFTNWKHNIKTAIPIRMNLTIKKFRYSVETLKTLPFDQISLDLDLCLDRAFPLTRGERRFVRWRDKWFPLFQDYPDKFSNLIFGSLKKKSVTVSPANLQLSKYSSRVGWLKFFWYIVNQGRDLGL